MKFKKDDLREIIKNEIRKMLDDDMLRDPPTLGDPHYTSYASKDDTCNDCGSTQCSCNDKQADPSICESCKIHPCECGYADIMEKKLVCNTCRGVLFMEGDCGCEKQVAMFNPHHQSDDDNHQNKPVAYMAKSQLMKIGKYAQKLQSMIPDDLDLDDWMRSHISQASDDIGEVYHKLDYQLSREQK